MASGAGKTVLILASMSHPSGAPIAALRLAAGLADRDHDVHAAFLYHREPMNGADFPATTLADKAPRDPVAFARMIMALWRLMRATRPDVVICFLPLASVVGANMARLAGVRRRIMSFRVPRETYSMPMRLADRATAWLGGYTDVVGVSRAMLAGCAAYPRWLRDRAVVIHNGLKGWQPSALDRDSARAALGLPLEARIVGAVGRLEYQKNPELLVDALALSADDVHVVLAGDGGLRAALVEQARRLNVTDRLHLLGDLARARVPDLLRAIDLFAQPSRFEGQSNALLEALHGGRACLVSDVPEQVETVTTADGAVAGRILPLDDATPWAEAMSNLHPDDAQVQAAVRTQAALFTFDRMIDAFDMLVRQGAGGSGEAEV